MIPLSLAAPLTPTERIAELERLAAELQRAALEQANRIAALEARAAEPVTPRQLEPLVQRNAQRVANAQALRTAIADILTAQSGSGEMAPKHVLGALERDGFEPLPALRTVRWHLQALRGNGSTAVLPSRRLPPEGVAVG